MQQPLALENATEVPERESHCIALGKGLRLEFENAREGRAVLYRGDFPIKTVDLGDNGARKQSTTDARELSVALGAVGQSRLGVARPQRLVVFLC